MEKEFERQDIPFAAQQPLKLSYKGDLLKLTYIPDFICYEKIILELKAAKELSDEHRAQLLNYLKATGLKTWLLD